MPFKNQHYWCVYKNLLVTITKMTEPTQCSFETMKQ